MIILGCLIVFISGIIGMYLDIHCKIKDSSLYWLIGMLAGIIGQTLILW